MNNKGFLLDTHVFVWWMEKSQQIPANLYNILNDPQNSVYLSVVSIWEMVLKRAKGKLKTTVDLNDIKSRGFITLPIEASHVLGIEKLSKHHADPFDRLLIAQAKIENLTLITADQKIAKYKIDILKI